jgi:hypothetical protein
MTIYAKQNPVGIDKQILKLQRKVDELTWGNIDVYGRVYINERNGVKVAEAYVGGDYKEIFVDDRKTAVFGFLVGETRSGLNMIKANVELICSCNLSKIGVATERNDEEVLLSVLKIIKYNTLFDNEREIKTGLENVFSQVSTEQFKFRDMQPYFNFSIGFDIVYKNEN